MAWIRLDDQIAHHPKFAKISGSAAWFWVTCLGYAQRYLTDGFVPHEALSSLCHIKQPMRAVAELLAVRLLESAEGGYQIHDYLVFNSSANEVRTEREWDRFRKDLYAQPELVKAIKVRDKNCCRYCGIEVNWADRRGPRGGQFDHVKPRGPNTLENLVVACRRCNCAKQSRTPEEANMPLLELVPIQFQNKSGLNLRARASYPSHPIPIVTTKKNKLATDAGDRTNSDEHANGGGGQAPKERGRKERPIYQSDRFVVFPWMLADIKRLLGPHFDAFDVTKYFDDLSAQSRESGLVIPQRGSGAWLETQVLAEARRRRLQIAGDKPVTMAHAVTAPEFLCTHVEKHYARWECDVATRLGRATHAEPSP